MHSMTGFGREELSDETTSVTVELSSVNRKQSEVHINLPKQYAFLEPQLRKRILQRISRGRVNVLVCLRNATSQSCIGTIDLDKAQAYERQFQELSKHLGRTLSLSASDFINIPELFAPKEINPESATTLITEASESALDNLLTMRSKEGAELKSDCIIRLQRLKEIHSQVTAIAPQSTQAYKQNLLNKLKGLDGTTFSTEELLKDERVLKEIALYADKSDITEELTRLAAHFTRFDEYLTSDTAVGRQLDFLCQELHRELNTINSKAQNSTIAHLIVTGKTEVEKIREQVQNIE